MTKEEAREKLTEYLNSTRNIWNDSIELPITDINIYTVVDYGSVESEQTGSVSTHIQSYSFRGLLKIAYDL